MQRLLVSGRERLEWLWVNGLHRRTEMKKVGQVHICQKKIDVIRSRPALPTVVLKYVFMISSVSMFFSMVPQETVAYFRTSPTDGLLSSDISSLRDRHGYNEFSVSTPEPMLLKFAKTIYESPLILLLCGSAAVSAIMGNIDDAISITVAVLIVLTGESTNMPTAGFHL
jgi:magnesium-transporting ATPase (P-type)